MITLVIDCSYNQRVALLENSKLVAEKNINMAKSDLLMKEIDDILKDNCFSISDIGEIAVNIGPGSFTGIRVAVSVAKGLGFARNLPYKTFTSFDYVDGENVVLLGFSDFVYAKISGKMNCLKINELDKQKQYFVANKEVFPKLETLGYDVKLLKEKSFDKMDFAQNKNTISISQIRPLYLRKSQAELQRESKLAGKSGN